ncbi:hypothetical protein [Nocardia noduli]|uniref:hypothetical protein n=1 Tax=Nocardia noduli TaxID=2815722 RepID=UPI001C2451BA|nr:hypothetical protein [Nocardia noduli]
MLDTRTVASISMATQQIAGLVCADGDLRAVIDRVTVWHHYSPAPVPSAVERTTDQRFDTTEDAHAYLIRALATCASGGFDALRVQITDTRTIPESVVRHICGTTVSITDALLALAEADGLCLPVLPATDSFTPTDIPTEPDPSRS